jgi:hypothetical protein
MQNFKFIFVWYIFNMKVLGKTMNQSGKVLGSQLTGHGMYLGSKVSPQQNKYSSSPSQNERVHRSDLERSHQIVKYGQASMSHGLGANRMPWQRKKNH